MKLLTLLKDLPAHTLTGSPQVKISHLECDSRRVLPGSCYIALKGTQADGHEFIPEAIRRGACAVVAEMPCTKEARDAGVSWVEVNDSRLAVSLMGAAWNGHPSRHMTMIGVTGTNGKTTTAYIAHSLLKQSWLRAGLIGTIAYDNGEEITPSTHTTPGPLELEHLLKEMFENGCRGVSMEVSSHALDQERVAGINFNVGIFTNLTQDHLDYHHTMENYFQAKAKLFEQMAQDTRARRKPVAVINIDDAYGRRLAEMFSGRMAVKTYGSALGADFRMLVHHATAKGSEYDRIQGLDLGADYYLTKPFGVMELISCVKAVLRRCGAENEKSTLNACGISMNTLEHTVSADGERITLTYKEYELLKLFLSHMGTAFTREQLMERVWGTDYMGETRTIDMHIRTLRQKLGKCGESIKTVRNVGYRMEEGQ